MCETQGAPQSAQSQSGRMLRSDPTFPGFEQERVLWKRGQEEMLGEGAAGFGQDLLTGIWGGG